MFWSVMIVLALAVAMLLLGLSARRARAGLGRPRGSVPRLSLFCAVASLALMLAAWHAPLAADPDSTQPATAESVAQPAEAAPALAAPILDVPETDTPAASTEGDAEPPAEEETEPAADGDTTGEATLPPAKILVKTAPVEDSTGRYPGWVVLLVVLGVLALPFVLASLLTKLWRLPEYHGKLSLIFLCLFAATAITVMAWPPKLGIDLKGGVTLVYEVKPEAKQLDDAGAEDDAAAERSRGSARLSKAKMEQLVVAISRRINPGGVKEVVIRPLGAGQIEIIIPEVDEAAVSRYKKIISSVGTLEFRILANTQDHRTLIDDARGSPATVLYLLDENGNRVQDDKGKWIRRCWWVQVAKGQEGNFAADQKIATRLGNHDGEEMLEILVAQDEYNVNGGYLTNSRAGVDDSLSPCVNFTFNDKGGQRFAGLTSDNLPDKVTGFRRRLGIILDGYLYSAPGLKTTIHNRGEISGSFTKQEAQDLVEVLNAGSLPTALSEKPISQLATGPILGRDTIRRGTLAIASSMVLVLLFMMVYYRFAGLVACLAILMNLLLILGVMITVKAAFTLPGLAGLVLTVGMAVDANVLIFERIREELDRGATLRMAIRNGFARATTTIVDANLTTLITGIVLYTIGTDQVRGFAVTMILGVTLSMFTAIYCARVVFDIGEKKRWLTKMHMMRILRGTQIDFLGMRRAAGVISIAVIVLGLIGVVARGKGILDIDFTGGVSVQTVFTEAQDVGDIRRDLASLPDLAVGDVQIPGQPPHRMFMINTSSPPDREAEDYLKEVKDKIVEIYGGKLAHYALTISVAQADSNEGEPAAEPVEWELDLGKYKLSYDVLRDDHLIPQMETLGTAGEFELTNKDYALNRDKEAGHSKWTATIHLPEDQARAVLEAMKTELENTPYFPSSNTIGGRVAGDTRFKAIAALLASLACIVGYIWIRFQRVMFGLAAVVALVHDILITLGVIALSFWLAPFLGILLIDEFKIGLSVLAAFLTIIGYSLNDTIVVFDRIREVRGKSPLLTAQMINTSINQTLARTLLTSFTTLLVVVILYVFGGQGIHAFAFSLVVGVMVGTYSSIFVASPALLWMAEASARAKTASRTGQ